MSILSLIRRELANAFLHDARRAIFLFGAATAYLILFGILYYPGVVKEIPTVVCDEEHTACLLYPAPSPRDPKTSRMPSSG